MQKPKTGKSARLLKWVSFDNDFKPAQLDWRFKKWIQRGITTYSLIATHSGLESFQRLTVTHNLDKQDFYRYLQLRHQFNNNIKITESNGPNLINLYIGAYKGSTPKELVSRIYSCVQLSKNHSIC